MADLVRAAEQPGHGVELEPNHSHFVLVRGRHWGDETATMYALTDALSRSQPSLAVFAGGGPGVLAEMEANVLSERTMLLIAGSGGVTDMVLAAHAGWRIGDARLMAIAQAGRIVPFEHSHSPDTLRELIYRCLFGIPSGADSDT